MYRINDYEKEPPTPTPDEEDGDSGDNGDKGDENDATKKGFAPNIWVVADKAYGRQKSNMIRKVDEEVG